MIFDLRKAIVAQLARAVFDHPPTDELADPWYFGDVEFEIQPGRQLRLITDLFYGASDTLADYSSRQIEEGCGA